ncbi:GNAT family N-acetyltransferase [Maribacter algarum]|uniref:GNAT family N-acetyltransferase n=1 Tax=Maribacter algarum (ex Zhang et al. 2020) TaxID=2578118 RepID=A0A5S3PT78_9FLAO|nr:GNAT family N-acetyltransferase [Maribacter algarum]TMM58153.1 GNAT family N-acetyltransferase [Maribacter algarum]
MNFNLQPFLDNDLVELRPLSQSDFTALYSIASDPYIWKQHQNKDRYTQKKFTEFFNEALNSKGALVIIDVQTKNVIGSSRFKIIDEDEKVVEIGWSFLGRAYWGGRYNRAFKQLMISHAMQNCNHVVFYVNSKNYRSQRAMEKLGARKMTSKEKTWVLNEDTGITYVIDSLL